MSIFKIGSNLISLSWPSSKTLDVPGQILDTFNLFFTIAKTFHTGLDHIRPVLFVCVKQRITA